MFFFSASNWHCLWGVSQKQFLTLIAVMICWILQLTPTTTAMGVLRGKDPADWELFLQHKKKKLKLYDQRSFQICTRKNRFGIFKRIGKSRNFGNFKCSKTGGPDFVATYFWFARLWPGCVCVGWWGWCGMGKTAMYFRCASSTRNRSP